MIQACEEREHRRPVLTADAADAMESCTQSNLSNTNSAQFRPPSGIGVRRVGEGLSSTERSSRCLRPGASLASTAYVMLTIAALAVLSDDAEWASTDGRR